MARYNREIDMDKAVLINFFVDREIAQKALLLAIKAGTNRSEIIRQALAEKLQQLQQEQAKA